MGTVYCGPFADKIDAYDHEGYVAQLLADGTEHTGHWLRECATYRAACACGWRGEIDYVASEAGEDLACDEWRHEHLQPLIDAETRKHTVRAAALIDLSHDLREATTETTTADGTCVLSEHSRGLIDAADRIDALLDELARSTAQDAERR